MLRQTTTALTNVEADHQRHRRRLEPLLLPPLAHQTLPPHPLLGGIVARAGLRAGGARGGGGGARRRKEGQGGLPQGWGDCSLGLPARSPTAQPHHKHCPYPFRTQPSPAQQPGWPPPAACTPPPSPTPTHPHAPARRASHHRNRRPHMPWYLRWQPTAGWRAAGQGWLPAMAQPRTAAAAAAAQATGAGREPTRVRRGTAASGACAAHCELTKRLRASEAMQAIATMLRCTRGRRDRVSQQLAPEPHSAGCAAQRRH